MSAEAREAVARALAATCCSSDNGLPCVECIEAELEVSVTPVLAALRPFIAAEIRAWAESETDRLGCPPGNIAKSADEIAARITTTGEQQ